MEENFYLGRMPFLKLYLRKSQEEWSISSSHELYLRGNGNSLELACQDFTQYILEKEERLSKYMADKKEQLKRTKRIGIVIVYQRLELYELDEHKCLALQERLDIDRIVLGLDSVEFGRQEFDAIIDAIKQLPAFPMRTNGMDGTNRTLTIRNGISNMNTFEWWSGCEDKNNAFATLVKHFENIYAKFRD